MKNKVPLVSVCIPTYNRSEFLKQALLSITTQFDNQAIFLETEIINPHFPALRSGHRLFQRPSPQKQFPSIKREGNVRDPTAREIVTSPSGDGLSISVFKKSAKNMAKRSGVLGTFAPPRPGQAKIDLSGPFFSASFCP